jgi:beta-aspartyl-peptidase (threonine type)
MNLRSVFRCARFSWTCCGVIAALVVATPVVAQTPTPRIAFAVHGGVDDEKQGELSAADEAAVRAGLAKALTAGYVVLQKGGTAVDAVEAALRTFEDDTAFDAGRGSVVNTEGIAELDASIMDGQSMKAGSVAALEHIAHPISLARLVMDRTRHVMLVGAGAERFAETQGVETVPNSYFITAARQKKYEEWRSEHGAAVPSSHHGTTGAVALDAAGNLAAGTTTGGTSWKLPGRVGDSPIPGAGTYASNELGCAVSSSGIGEYFIRYTVAADICHRMAYLHESAEQAANYVIEKELKGLGGDGGVIVLDRAGHSVRVFNTHAFWRGYIDAKGNAVVEIF